MRNGSTPKPWVAARASPESFSRMRLKTGVVIYRDSIASSTTVDQDNLLRRSGFTAIATRVRECNRRPHLAYLESGEPSHRDILTQLPDLGCDQLPDGNGLVLDEGLLQKADLFIKLRSEEHT